VLTRRDPDRVASGPRVCSGELDHAHSTAVALHWWLGVLTPPQTGVSLDLGPAYRTSVRRHAPQATICADPFHLVALANRAVDTMRREIW
jgi:hypothetical protein